MLLHVVPYVELRIAWVFYTHHLLWRVFCSSFDTWAKKIKPCVLMDDYIFLILTCVVCFNELITLFLWYYMLVLERMISNLKLRNIEFLTWNVRSKNLRCYTTTLILRTKYFVEGKSAPCSTMAHGDIILKSKGHLFIMFDYNPTSAMLSMDKENEG